MSTPLTTDPSDVSVSITYNPYFVLKEREDSSMRIDDI